MPLLLSQLIVNPFLRVTAILHLLLILLAGSLLLAKAGASQLAASLPPHPGISASHPLAGDFLP